MAIVVVITHREVRFSLKEERERENGYQLEQTMRKQKGERYVIHYRPTTPGTSLSANRREKRERERERERERIVVQVAERQ